MKKYRDHKGMEGNQNYRDFIAVEKNKNEIIPEATPEGPYGSPIEGTLGKNSPWKEDQQAISAFTYENRNLHEGLERKDPGAHPTHDDKRQNKDEPF
ncbi:hypothetical protein [Evansella cellulosilytica]|uniref:Cytosolic protein n=1 Tax=Evansella cellulosilytica (strain ATCC 21833 / DSM 2522 / FERM P-1141 / JCM 9156 / N-4) TaxID=649639 RepID=E6U2E7_EVAC2|nr:hypothetical protein [Evansella cellulosilytica]ADU31660.1 hypothetical protein Bcell_3418 [Evansella cellulosilytica DSM 2522]